MRYYLQQKLEIKIYNRREQQKITVFTDIRPKEKRFHMRQKNKRRFKNYLITL